MSQIEEFKTKVLEDFKTTKKELEKEYPDYIFKLRINDVDEKLVIIFKMKNLKSKMGDFGMLPVKKEFINTITMEDFKNIQEAIRNAYIDEIEPTEEERIIGEEISNITMKGGKLDIEFESGSKISVISNSNGNLELSRFVSDSDEAEVTITF